MQQQQPGSGHDGQQGEATSRLCVKNIPKHLTEQRLKEHFSAKGQVTDVKILKTRDGHSRQMAFVGYRSVEDSAAAMQYFQNTYIDTSRLSIEYARRYRAAPTAAADASAASAAAAADKQHRPWSKYSEGSSKHQQLLAKQAAAAAAAAAAGNDPKAAAKAARAAAKAAKAAKKAAHKGQVDEAAQADPKLAEFLQLMQPRSKARIWGNDELLPQQDGAAGQAGATAAAAGAGAMAVDADDEADELYVDLADLKQQQQQQQQQQQPGRHKPAAAAGQQPQQHPEGSDDADDEGEEQEDDELLASKDAVVVDEGVSDLDYLKARMRKTVPQTQQQQQQQQGSSSSSSDEDEMSSSSSDEEDADAADAAAAGEDNNDVDMLGSDDAAEPQDDGDEEDEAEGDQFDAAAAASGGGHSAAAAAAGAAEAEVLETGRLFVRNLAYSAGEAELSQLFGGFGDLEGVHLVLDRETKRSRGIAYVKYVMPEDALAAYRALDMSPFQGRLLHVLPAKRQPGEDLQQQQQQQEDEVQGGKLGSSSYKSQRDEQRKGDAGNRAAWSSLFMRADTVAAAVAAHYGVSKAQLLDATAADLPLRMALGEAQVLAQTKAALLDGGINVSALEAAAAASGKAAAKASVARSATTLLVKNLPYAAEEEELRSLFAGQGDSRVVVRLVLPPTRTLALVEFGEAQDARSAFKALAYKKYQQVPLYLEWAPRDIWDSPAPAAAAKPAAAAAAAAAAAVGDSKAATGPAADTAAAAVGSNAAAAAAAAAAAEEDEADGDGSEAPVACIYVKNLNFATGDAALRKHFDKAVSAAGGSIHSAKVARRKGPDGKLLSMGFGFVETDSEAAAKAAIKALQGSMLEKHKLQLQLSKHGASGAAAAAGSAASKKEAAAKAAAATAAGTKLVVRNVAFEATRKDLMGLFGPFGHIKSCRLPKKFDGNHRGFAFLEFTTKQEAQNALEGVGGTHLYGRRLVVEYAQADDEAAGLDELRARTAAKFAAGQEEEQLEAPAPKRLKRNL